MKIELFLFVLFNIDEMHRRQQGRVPLGAHYLSNFGYGLAPASNGGLPHTYNQNLSEYLRRDAIGKLYSYTNGDPIRKSKITHQSSQTGKTFYWNNHHLFGNFEHGVEPEYEGIDFKKLALSEFEIEDAFASRSDSQRLLYNKQRAQMMRYSDNMHSSTLSSHTYGVRGVCQ